MLMPLQDTQRVWDVLQSDIARSSLAAAVIYVQNEARAAGWAMVEEPKEAALLFPIGEKLPSADCLALHEGLLDVAGVLLSGHDAEMADVRLVAASLQSSGTAASRIPVLSAASLMPGSEAVEMVLDLGDVSQSLVHPLGVASSSAALAKRSDGLVMRVAFCRALDTWVRADGFTGAVAGNGALIESLSPRQRCALGFPKPGHPRVATSAIRQLVSRYPGLDVAPYNIALELQSSHRPPDVAGSPLLTGPIDFMSEAKRLDELDEPPWRTQTGIGAPREVTSSRWLLPVRALPEPELPATTAMVDQWREQGWLLIDGVLPLPVLHAASDAATDLFPSKLAAQGVYSEAMAEAGYHSFGGSHEPTNTRYSRAAFPFERGSALNTVSLHPRLLTLVSQLLAVPSEELRLTQCFVTAKYGDHCPDNIDEWDWRTAADHQPMHRDTLTNSLLQPSRDAYHWGRPEDVQAILYYGPQDASEAGGPTAFVPGLRYQDPGSESLYDKEVYPRYQQGTLLLWQLGIWHRGTPVNPGAVRRKHHLSFRRADATWIGGSAAMGELSPVALESLASTVARSRRQHDRRSIDLEIGRFWGMLSPLQRTVSGCFPPVGSAYWNDATRATVYKRFGGVVDLQPYSCTHHNRSKL